MNPDPLWRETSTESINFSGHAIRQMLARWDARAIQFQNHAPPIDHLAERTKMRYLLVTSIPFARQNESILIDGLWAEDLRGLVAAVGAVTIAAPEVNAESVQPWGPAVASISPADQMRFLSLPEYTTGFNPQSILRCRKVLRQAVGNADIIHSSNLFHPYTPLYYAHDLAVRLKKKTLFVVAEDFYDMQTWGWLRIEQNWLKRCRVQWQLRRLDGHVRKRVRTSSLTLLHTPAAVARYRSYAANAVAIRQSVHEEKDVISIDQLQIKCASIRNNEPLILSAACRMEFLKGMDFVVRAISILKRRGILVRAHLYGQGKQLENFRLLAKRLGVEEQVDLPGPLAPMSVLREALAMGHVFLMPHLTTDFGRAFFDAMAAGSPVIAFRSIASEDTVRNGIDGLITPNADDEGLADGIARFHHDREMLVRAAYAARTRALENTRSFWNDYRIQMVQGLFDSPERE